MPAETITPLDKNVFKPILLFKSEFKINSTIYVVFRQLGKSKSSGTNVLCLILTPVLFRSRAARWLVAPSTGFDVKWCQ